MIKPERTLRCRDINNENVDVAIEQVRFRPSIYGIVVRDHKILLVPQFGDGYDFPGGGIDLGETLEEGLKREVKEETGLDVNMGEIIHAESDLFYFTNRNEAAHTILLFYTCTDPRGKISTEGFDAYEKKYASQAEWIDLKKIDDLKFYNPVDSPAVIRKALKS